MDMRPHLANDGHNLTPCARILTILLDGSHPCINRLRLSENACVCEGVALLSPNSSNHDKNHGTRAGRSGDANTAQRIAHRIHENRGKTTESMEIMKTLESRNLHSFKDLQPW